MAYKGFDIDIYPGDTAMANFWNNTPFSFTGFYLGPAPNHSDTTWMNTKSYLESLGYGFLVIYVGQQAGDTSYLTYAQGQNDAANAASLASQAGFNTEYDVIYLDIEQGGSLNQDFIDYIDGWIDYIVDSTIYMPGIYCSYETADQIKNSSSNAGNLSNIRYWVFNINEPPSPGCTTNTSDSPSDSGVSYASSWQYIQECVQEWNGTTLTVDLDLSNYSNPSAG
ncbi:glycoside hydrolase domain-containing protein [Alicyclobacillus tolerans]|uniref:Rv2525c-like glycoside hydrolase-like domain-containing protein n=1 Tax=Alicyclobacillus tolerans TaxID=90970 RepID=A0A1M6WIK1_9BACL|nr:glycoside hydrolase domain-containing protein [Alicyclobacillus montanus]SHK93454.1 protein of unknown function [Alicyclobacillus montanus]